MGIRTDEFSVICDHGHIEVFKAVKEEVQWYDCYNYLRHFRSNYVLLGGARLWLASLGGSLFYLLADVLSIASAALPLIRRSVAQWSCGGFAIIALLWAIREVDSN